MRRLQKALTTRGLAADGATTEYLEQALGEQQITVTGVPRGSHFACVLVAADVMLKRLGMNLEPAPIKGLPGYLEMLQASAVPVPRNAMPRFWLAPHYDVLLADGEGLAWQLRGSGVQVLAEDGLVKGDGARVTAGAKEHSLADEWAQRMTAKYADLSAALPVFQQLRNCIDLAVVGALFVNEELPGKANCDLSPLYDPNRVQVAEYHVPAKVASHASLMRKGHTWFVAVSGGVAVDSWPVLNHVKVEANLATRRHEAARTEGDRWWWD
jgi:hypothetical protein